jgi:hypothetical protein
MPGAPMQPWELAAREAIRDLVARYNANADTGRFEQVLDLFGPEATMTLFGDGEERVYAGREEIKEIFTGARDMFRSVADAHAGPLYVRHFVATHQIDVVDRQHAKGRSYFQVLMAHGLDHWGRYLDEYVEADGRWRFLSRQVHTDGFSEQR